MEYTIEQKIAAVNLIMHKEMSYQEAEQAIGISHETIRRWHHRFEKDPQSLYPASRTSTDKDGDEVMDLKNLPDDPDELKKIIFDMQFEIDLREAVCDILKKTQASTRRRFRTGRRAFWWTP